jgi:hypothetical protein
LAVKRPGRGTDHPSPSSTEVTEKWELCSYRPSAFLACSWVKFNFTFSVNVNPKFQDRVHLNFSVTLKEIRDGAIPNWRGTGTNPTYGGNLDNPQERCAWTGDDYVTIHECLSLSCHGLLMPICWSCSEVSTCNTEDIFTVNDADGENDRQTTYIGFWFSIRIIRPEDGEWNECRHR